MRVVHMTDVHFHQRPRLGEVFNKRFLGLTNLYALGRIHHFDASAVVGSAVQDALAQEPDLFVMTGDMTALAAEAEFVLARNAFAPLLEAVPSVVVPGNHDLYTREARKAARMERHFGPWMKGGEWDGRGWTGPDPAGAVPWPVRFRLDDVDVVATNPCRPVLRSTGRFGPEALERASGLVREGLDAGQSVVYAMHYPPLWDDGRVYDRPGHNLVDQDALIASLRAAPPHVLLHGHNHSCWRTALPAEPHPVHVLNCGTSSAISGLPDRTAGYFVFELEGGELRSVRRRMLLAESGTWEDHPAAFEAA